MEKVVRIYNSFEEAEKDNARQISKMSIQERLDAFGELQAKVFGKEWTETPIKKIVSIEKVSW